MNKAPTRITAASSRSPRALASVRPFLRSVVLGLVLAGLGLGQAVAGPFDFFNRKDDRNNQERSSQQDRNRDNGRQDQRDNGRDRDNRDRDNREAREMRAFESREEQRRLQQIQQEQNSGNEGRRRMSDDQRRDLRRQINEAGQDIYTVPPRR